MANKLYEENNIQAIANAIRTKNESEDTYTVSQMAPAILNLPDKMPTISNGHIETLYAMNNTGSTTTIPKNSFVELDYYGQSSIKTRSGRKYYSEPLGDNKFIVCSQRYDSTNGTFLELVVESIENNAEISGTPLTISLGSSSSSYDFFKFILVSQTKGFIIHKYNKTTITCIPININGYVITNEEPYDITGNYYNSQEYFDCDAIGTNKFLIAYRKPSVTFLYGKVFEYNNGEYSVGDETQITNTGGTAYNISVVGVNTDKAIIFHDGSSNYTLWATGVSVSDLSITSGTSIEIDGSRNSSELHRRCAIKHTDNTAILCASTPGIFSSFRYVTINDDNSITRTGSYANNSMYNFAQKTSIAKLSNDLYIATGNNYEYNLCYYLVKTSNNTSFTFYAPYIGKYFSSNELCVPVVINTNKVLILSRQSMYMYLTSDAMGMGFLELNVSLNGSQYVLTNCIKRVIAPMSAINRPNDSKDKKIDGIALDQITSTIPGRVYLYGTS